GERLSSDSMEGASQAEIHPVIATPIRTQRVGLDGRLRRPVPKGLLTVTSEISAGRDVPNAVFTQLYQAEYLRASRRWGLATQYRRFHQDRIGEDASIIGEFS